MAGGFAINIHILFELADMFRFRWDPATLACLADKPLRFRALARQLGQSIDDRIEDNALARSLGRLKRSGYVVAHRSLVGRRTVPLYQITDQGRAQLNRYRALVITYQQLGIPPEPPQPNGARPHAGHVA